MTSYDQSWPIIGTSYQQYDKLKDTGEKMVTFRDYSKSCNFFLSFVMTVKEASQICHTSLDGVIIFLIKIQNTHLHFILFGVVFFVEVVLIFYRVFIFFVRLHCWGHLHFWSGLQFFTLSLFLSPFSFIVLFWGHLHFWSYSLIFRSSLFLRLSAYSN